MNRTTLLFYFLLISVCVWGCSSDDSQTPLSDAFASADGSSPDTDSWENNPDCFFDCFGSVPTCRNGVITAYYSFLAECDTPGIPTSCVYDEYHCEQGCRPGAIYPRIYNRHKDNPPLVILCNEYEPPPDPEPDATPDIDDPNCHTDCFGGEPICTNGLVIQKIYAPIPCGVTPQEGMTSVCDRLAYTCEQGCREGWSALVQELEDSQVNFDFFYDFSIFCQENTPTQGSPCFSDIECLLVEDREASPPVVDHLKCDTTLQQCVSARTPPPSDYLQTCKLDIPLPNQQFVETDACIGGVCLVANDLSDPEAIPCKQALQGCSLRCALDTDCPEGSLCSPISNDRGQTTSLCKPGPSNQWDNLGLSDSCP